MRNIDPRGFTQFRRVTYAVFTILFTSFFYFQSVTIEEKSSDNCEVEFNATGIPTE